ncbi:MAG: hypothetical protein AAFQ89_00985 [Cyanobacteria bacterium J06626_18]
MRRNLLMFGLLSACLSGLGSRVANASTTVDYSSPCEYFNAEGTLQATTTCNVNFGIIGVDQGTRFILTFPDGAEVWIYDYVDGETQANGVPSDMAIAGDNVVLATEDGEVFIFKASPRE